MTLSEPGNEARTSHAHEQEADAEHCSMGTHHRARQADLLTKFDQSHVAAESCGQRGVAQCQSDKEAAAGDNTSGGSWGQGHGWGGEGFGQDQLNAKGYSRSKKGRE